MSKVTTVAASIGLMLGASVGHAQGGFPSSQSPGNVQFQQGAYPADQNFGTRPYPETRPGVSPDVMARANPVYVSCWAEVTSLNTAYFSATFLMPAFNTLKDQFRTFVTTQYGPASKLQCTTALSNAAVTKQVDKWKDSARTTNNAIIDLVANTGEETAKAPQRQSSQSVRYEPPHIGFLDGYVPGGYVPGNNSSGTVAGQSNFQR
jgi:hypothetical protein